MKRILCACLALVSLSACGSDPVLVECAEVEYGDQRYCVVKRDDITETGYDCPSNYDHQHNVDGYVVCSNDSNTPAQWPPQWSTQISDEVKRHIGRNPDYPDNKKPNSTKDPNTAVSQCQLTLNHKDQRYIRTSSYNAAGHLLNVTSGEDGSITEQEYTYNDRGQLLREARFGDVLYIYTYEGDLLVTETYKSGDETELTTYQYDKEKRLVSMQIQYLDSEGMIKNEERKTYTYDKLDRLVRVDSEEGDGVEISLTAYSADGLIRREYVDSNNNGKVDDEDRILEEVYHSPEGKKTRSIMHSEAFGGPNNIVERTYDQYGNYLHLYAYKTKRRNFEYEYDEQNRLTKMNHNEPGWLIIDGAIMNMTLTYEANKISGVAVFDQQMSMPEEPTTLTFEQVGQGCSPLTTIDAEQALTLGFVFDLYNTML